MITVTITPENHNQNSIHE